MVKEAVMRDSIVKRIPMENGKNLDIVKSTHFGERDAERNINGLMVAVEKVTKVYIKILDRWAKTNQPKLEGVIKSSSGLNIVYSVYANRFDPNCIDFVMQTIINKQNFTAKKHGDFIIIAD